MFTCEMNQLLMKKFLDIANLFALEGHLDFQQDKIVAASVDTANIAMTFVTVPCNLVGEPRHLAVDYTKVSGIVSGIKNNTVLMEYDDNKIIIRSGRYKYMVSTLMTSYVRKVKKLNFDPPVVFNVKASDISESLLAVSRVFDKKDLGAAIRVTLDKGTLLLQDNERTEIDVNYTPEEVRVLKGESQVFLLSRDYCEYLANGLKYFDTVTIKTGPEMPVFFECVSDTIVANIAIAPRVETV